MIKKEGAEWCVYKADGSKTCYPSEDEAKAEKAKLEKSGEYALHDIRGVEIFATGTHNGDAYDEKDLDDIVAAFQGLDFKPPLKSGHSKDEPGMPSLGWVENLRKQGSKLVADFVGMPQIVYDYIREKRFNTVSSEVYWNLRRGPQSFRRALKAVALLGADIPAVAGLRPLHELFSAEAGEVHTAEAIQLFAAANPHGGSMTPEQVKELQDKLAAAEARNKELEAQAKAHAEATAKLEADNKKNADGLAELTARFEALSKGTNSIDDVRRNALVAEANAKADAERKAREASDAAAKAALAAKEAAESAITAEREKVAKLEEDARKVRIKDLIASVKIPAFRPLFAQYADLVTRQPDTKVYDLHGGEHAGLKALEDHIKMFNADSAKIFKVFSREEPIDGRQPDSPDMEVDKLTKQYMAEHKVAYTVAMQKVLDSNPALKEAYAKRSTAAA